MKKKEFEFKLESPITYQYEMGERKSDLLLFKAPTCQHKDALDALRKELVGGMMKHSYQAGNDGIAQPKNKKEVEIDSDMMLFCLYSPSFDIKKYKEIFWDMVLDGLCFIDKKIPLTKSLLGDIDADDEAEMVGEYTANFIAPRWLKRQMSK